MLGNVFGSIVVVKDAHLNGDLPFACILNLQA